MKYLRSSGFLRLLQALSQDGYDVFGPVKRGDSLVLQKMDVEAAAPPVWNEYRLAESFKPMWFQTGKVVVEWTADGPRSGPEPRPRAVVGLKACDLKAVEVLDKVFRDHDFQEPAWCAARERNLVISGDCTAAGETCFCTMLGDRPHPESHFDLNLSPAKGGYLVDVGSEKGRLLVEAHEKLFETAPSELIAARDATREEVRTFVAKQSEPYAVKDPFELSVEKNTKTRIWGKLAATCVECNACNLVCPTCHCFILHDVKTEDGSARISMWDSCFQAGYARMAGGGTPRLQLTERFRNHYYHKFVSFPKNWEITACSGCGRCIDACMGRIDKRECLHRLETEWIPSEVLPEIR